jgi:hypothetical protein
MIYYRVKKPQNGELVTGGGAFGDLKTLKGATRRLQRWFPSWTEIEVQFEPFPSQEVK